MITGNEGKMMRYVITGVLIIGVITTAFSSSLSLSGATKTTTDNQPPFKKIILVKIDLKDIYCPLCLEPLKTFCEMLSNQEQDISALGILVFRKSEYIENPGIYIKIIEKQLRGFMSGNNIQFPVIIDINHVFDKENFGDWDVILLDASRKLLKKYSFPLSTTQLEEINFY